MSEPLAADLNVLYDAERVELVATVSACRAAIEERIAEMYGRYGDLWSANAKREAHDWVADRFPWMSEENVGHGIAQGVYYAWHG